MRSVITREQVQSATNLAIEWVDLPEWGGENNGVYVREMTGKERDEYEISLMVGKGRKRQVSMENSRAKLAARVMVDEEGNRIFTEKDAEWLGSRSSAAINRVVEVAQRLSGLTQEEVEELTGNSSAGQNEDSTSDSPASSVAR